MDKRSLSKLQVRAEVLAVIQQLSTLESSSRETQTKQIKRLKSIEEEDYIIDCLLRELSKASYDQNQVVAQLLIEFGSLDKLEKPLWGIIKDSDTSDELKDIANSILRNMGDTSDPDLYLSYLKNPQDLIDKETERMLKMASKNPESQIDFLDFLFSLPEAEQVNLIDSLKVDYPSEYLSCILIPAIEIRPEGDIYHLIIEALGTTRNPEALELLEGLYNSSEDELEKKKIKKSMNLLKLSGAQSNKDSSSFIPDVLLHSKVFKCYASAIDGIGNQGIIFSRLLNNGDIVLLSVVINDVQGIVDCFGIGQLSEKDFDRIISKFQEGASKIDISPEYCKKRLLEAEELSRALKIPIPYEYSAWKVLAKDIIPLDFDVKDLIKELKDDELIEKLSELYKIPDFSCWFIEDDDHPGALDFFKMNLSFFVANLDNDDLPLEEFCEFYDERILDIVEQVFDRVVKDLYYNRLLHQSYLLKYNNRLDEAKLAATAAWTLQGSDCPISVKENKFILTLMRKSVAESLLRYQYKIDDKISDGNSIVSKEKMQKFKFLLDKFFEKWQIGF